MQARPGFDCSQMSIGAFSREELTKVIDENTHTHIHTHTHTHTHTHRERDRLTVINNNPTRKYPQNDYCLVGELA